MPSAPTFDLDQACPAIEQALEQAGFDVIRDPGEPNLVQARRDEAGASTGVFIDAAGRMRFTVTRQSGPERSEALAGPGKREFHITRQTTETATVSYQLARRDVTALPSILAALQKI